MCFPANIFTQALELQAVYYIFELGFLQFRSQLLTLIHQLNKFSNSFSLTEFSYFSSQSLCIYLTGHWRHLMVNWGESQLLPAVAIVVWLSLCFKGFQLSVSYQTLKSIFFHRQTVWAWNQTWWSPKSQNNGEINNSDLLLVWVLLPGKVPPVGVIFRNVGHKGAVVPWHERLNGHVFSL